MKITDDDAGDATNPKKKFKLILVASFAALLLGGGAFYAVTAGLIDGLLPGGAGHGDQATIQADDSHSAYGAHTDARSGQGDRASASGPATFVMLEPLIISLGPESRSKHLKVTLAIDASPGRGPEIRNVMPRVVDILQGFLRAVDEREFEIPRSMDRLRAQMLRRVQLVTPTGSVQDLLIQEFVLN